MLSTNSFLGTTTHFTLNVESTEQIVITTQDPSNLIRVSWTKVESNKVEGGGTGYGQITAGVLVSGNYIFTIVSNGPGTISIINPPPLPN